MRAEFTNSVNIKGLNEVIAAHAASVATIAAGVSVSPAIFRRTLVLAASFVAPTSSPPPPPSLSIHLCEWKMRACVYACKSSALSL